jgi:putative transposase
VHKLAQANRMLGNGKDVADVCRELQISEQTYYRGRNQFGGLKADDAKRLKELERENSALKRLLADAELEKAALKEIARGNGLSRCPRRGRERQPQEDPTAVARGRPTRAATAAA